jgi:nucleoside-diphosphate-sugar epimerase
MAAHHERQGTLNLPFEFAARETESHGCPVVSSIRLHRCARPSDLETRRKPRVREADWNMPITMYGCNKLTASTWDATMRSTTSSCSRRARGVDFRCVRFPGLISAMTVPSGGTSDYAPEMIHAAARGEPYACFVRPDTRIPFMAMPDAIEALLKLSTAQASRLSCSAYNVRAFNPSADEVRGARAFRMRRSPTRWTRSGRAS